MSSLARLRLFGRVDGTQTAVHTHEPSRVSRGPSSVSSTVDVRGDSPRKLYYNYKGTSLQRLEATHCERFSFILHFPLLRCRSIFVTERGFLRTIRTNF